MAAKPDPLLSIAQALENCAKGLNRIADSIQRLGNGDAVTNGVGAIEGHSIVIRDSLNQAAETIADALRGMRDED